MNHAPAYRSKFADAIEEGDTISLYRDGSSPLEVIAEPVRVKNLVGERSHVIFQVRRLHTEVEGQMIFQPANVVYRWTKEK